MKLEVDCRLVISAKIEHAAGMSYTTPRLGMNYVCAECGALLYHSGIDGAYEAGAVSFPAKQPAEVVGRLHQCPRCGHRLNSDPDSDSIQIRKENRKIADSRGDAQTVLNRTSSVNVKMLEGT